MVAVSAKSETIGGCGLQQFTFGPHAAGDACGHGRDGASLHQKLQDIFGPGDVGIHVAKRFIVGFGEGAITLAAVSPLRCFPNLRHLDPQLLHVILALPFSGNRAKMKEELNNPFLVA